MPGCGLGLRGRTGKGESTEREREREREREFFFRFFPSFFRSTTSRMLFGERNVFCLSSLLTLAFLLAFVFFFPPLQNTRMGTCCGYPVEGFKDSGRASSGNASSPAATGFSGGGGTTASGFLFTLCLVEGRCPSLDGYDRGNGFSPWFVALLFGVPSSSPSPPSAPAPFACAAAERWLGLRRGPWSDASLRGMMAGRVSLLSSGPGERALARWPALAAAATEAAGATAAAAAAAAAAAGGKEGGGARETNTLVAAVGGTIERWLLERAEWLDGAFEQARGDATRGRAYPASYAA